MWSGHSCPLGYMKITPEFRLRVYARDYNKLPNHCVRR
jgi:hypothetical protein